jgi:excisionase family DNA binding protein
LGARIRRPAHINRAGEEPVCDREACDRVSGRRTSMHRTDTDKPVAIPKLVLTIDEAALALGIGKTLLRELLSHDEIISVRLGRRRLIPLGALEAYIARRCAVA